MKLKEETHKRKSQMLLSPCLRHGQITKGQSGFPAAILLSAVSPLSALSIGWAPAASQALSSALYVPFLQSSEADAFHQLHCTKRKPRRREVNFHKPTLLISSRWALELRFSGGRAQMLHQNHIPTPKCSDSIPGACRHWSLLLLCSEAPFLQCPGSCLAHTTRPVNKSPRCPPSSGTVLWEG